MMTVIIYINMNYCHNNHND